MDIDVVDTPEYYCVQRLQQQRNADRAECKALLEKLEDENIELQAKNKELKSMSDLKYKNKVADMEQKHKASLENQRNRQLYEYKRGIQNQINTDRAECENVIKNVVQNVRAEYEDALNNANAIIKARNNHQICVSLTRFELQALGNVWILVLPTYFQSTPKWRRAQ